jgi:hypothetical protein
MNWLQTLLLVIALVALVAELVGLVGRKLNKPWGDLISPIMRRDGCRWWFIPFLWGVMGGHWFGWPLQWDPGWIKDALLVTALVGVFARDLFIGTRVQKESLSWLFLGGILVGLFLWNQG